MDPFGLAVAAVFEGPQLLNAVAGMVGIIESTDCKIDKLVSKDFEAGTQHLRELLLAKQEADFLLRMAWNRFAGAIATESGVRKASAYVALAFCQHRLGETKIAISTLRDLTIYKYAENPMIKASRNLLAWEMGIGAALVTTAVWLFTPSKDDTRSPLAVASKFAKLIAGASPERQVELLKRQAATTIAVLERTEAP